MVKKCKHSFTVVSGTMTTGEVFPICTLGVYCDKCGLKKQESTKDKKKVDKLMK